MVLIRLELTLLQFEMRVFAEVRFCDVRQPCFAINDKRSHSASLARHLTPSLFPRGLAWCFINTGVSLSCRVVAHRKLILVLLVFLLSVFASTNVLSDCSTLDATFVENFHVSSNKEIYQFRSRPGFPRIFHSEVTVHNLSNFIEFYWLLVGERTFLTGISGPSLLLKAELTLQLRGKWMLWAIDRLRSKARCRH